VSRRPLELGAALEHVDGLLQGAPSPEAKLLATRVLATMLRTLLASEARARADYEALQRKHVALQDQFIAYLEEELK
jgi:hypothetical protein